MPGKLTYRTGFTLSVLAVLFLIFDGVIKLLDLEMVRQSMAELGYPVGIAVGIGLLELACLALYVVPLWGGLFLRDQRLRAFLPIRQTA